MDATSDELLHKWANSESNTYLVNPTGDVLSEVIEILSESQSTEVRCLVNAQTLRALDRQYTLASRMSELETNGRITFHETTGREQANLLVSDGTLSTCLDLGELRVVTAVETGSQKLDTEQVDDFITQLDQRWAQKDEISLRTPVTDDVQKAFELTCDTAVYDRFESIVAKMEQQVKRDGTSEEVEFADRQHTYAAVVIAGAIEQVTQGDLGNATETCGLASRSTVYRFKRGLRESGLIGVRQVEGGRGGRSKELAITKVYQNEDLDTLVERAYNELAVMDDSV